MGPDPLTFTELDDVAIVQADLEQILDGRPRASDIAHRFHELENGAAG